MTWKLWLDDQCRDPDLSLRHPPEGFIGAVSSDEALALIQEHGLPSFIDFDHDLGIVTSEYNGRTITYEDSAMKFLTRLQSYLLNKEGTALEEPPEFAIHSMNQVGAANIRSFMKSWKTVAALDRIKVH